MRLSLNSEWQLEDYLQVFWLHRWLILLTTLAFGGSMAIHMAQQPNIYQATTRILIEVNPPQVVQFQEVVPYGGGGASQNFLQTEYRVITSRAVLTRVIEDLHLSVFPPFSRVKDPVKFLQGMLKVDPIRGTKLVDISVSGTKMELVSRIANAVADTYARRNLERRREMTSGSVEWLQEEVTKMEAKMRASQLTLQAFREEYGSVDFGEEHQNNILQRLRDLNTAITETRKQRIEAETKYREKHPILLELQAKERELQLVLQDQEQQALEMSRLSIQYNALLREAKTSEEIYNILLTRLKELSVQEGLRSNNVQVVDYARIPDEPIGPPRGQFVSIATLVGLALGCVLAVTRERFTKTMKTRRDFEQVMGISFLGSIPLMPARRTSEGIGNLPLLADSKSSISEAIRNVRTTLEFLLPTGRSSILLITSALPSEGKSTLALNLAVALQELGRRVLLIDADLRRPNLHRLLQTSLQPGLSDYLQEKAIPEEIVQVVPKVKNLSVVTAGTSPPQPTDLLSSARFKQILEAWRQEYRYILLDTPPVLVVADASVLAGISDGVLFVVRAGRTNAEAAQAGKQRLVDVGAKLLGGILNGARLELERGYRYYYYYGKDRPSR